MRNAFASILLPCALAAAQPAPPDAPWWERETQMAAGGELLLSSRPWWDQAVQIQGDAALRLRSEYSGGGMMLVRRETGTRSRRGETILVWILDDDGDMDAKAPEPDRDSDCYVADFAGDGTADRMVDYIDSDGDQAADEMEIRYFVDGRLRRAWFGVDLDRDGQMWDVADYEYTGDFFRSDPYGDALIFMNKYDPRRDAWVPISECPFAFYDTDDDGESEAVVRFSVAPVSFSPATDPDYANSQARYEGEFDPAMDAMAVVNIRYGLDIDDLSSAAEPLHYELGFNMTGSIPYEFEGMRRHEPLRRAPKTVVCIPHARARIVAEIYPAAQTGLSWREFGDATLRLGHPEHPADDRRWEGVFWTWERQFMHNTGGPVQEWNVRREFLPAAAACRKLYYSPVDRRLHLKGAREGWLRIGHLAGNEELGEIRIFDTNDDGYFDRWEHYAAGEPEPYRVACVPEARGQDLGSDWMLIQALYNRKLLPEAIALNRGLLAAVERLGGAYAPPLPAPLAAAMAAAGSPEEERFVLDQARELRYRAFSSRARARDLEALSAAAPEALRRGGETGEQSTRQWENARLLSAIDAAYAAGDLARATALLQSYQPAAEEAADAAYIERFRQHFQAASGPLPSLREYARPERYDQLYMDARLDAAIEGIDNESGGIAWGLSYRMASLNEMYRATADAKYLEANLKCIRAVIRARDDAQGKALWTGAVAQVWGSGGYSPRGRAAYAVHTGMIVYPMLDFLTLVRRDARYRSSLGAEFDQIAQTAEASLAHHDCQWRDGPEPGAGHYVGKDQEPALDGKPLPGNRLSSMGRALWLAWEVTGEPAHRERALALGRYIRNRLSMTPQGAFCWPYRLPIDPVGDPDSAAAGSSGEDVSHGSLTAALPVLLAAAGELFDGRDMERLGRTVTRGLARLGAGVLLADVGGSPRGDPDLVQIPARWLCLTPFAPEVYDRISLFYRAYVPSPGPLDLALLIRYGSDLEAARR